MKNQRALFECCGQHIELIPQNGKLLSHLTCVGNCEDAWICLKLIEAYRECREMENDIKESVKR